MSGRDVERCDQCPVLEKWRMEFEQLAPQIEIHLQRFTLNPSSYSPEIQAYTWFVQYGHPDDPKDQFPGHLHDHKQSIRRFITNRHLDQLDAMKYLLNLLKLQS